MASGRALGLLCCLAAAGPALSGQRLLLVSEFQRIGPSGEALPIDHAPTRREILSPALARNAYATFRLAVQAPPGQYYTLYVAQNPENTARITLFQESPTRVGTAWFPDALQPAALPVHAVFPDDRQVQTFLLDLFLPPETPPARFRLEIQLHASGRWVIYPMEIRPTALIAPPVPPLRGTLPSAAGRADAAAAAALRQTICPTALPRPLPALDSTRAILFRNALQDIAIARARASIVQDPSLVERLWRAGGWDSRQQFCASTTPAPLGPEWWLRLRGFLYQGLPLQELEQAQP